MGQALTTAGTPGPRYRDIASEVGLRFRWGHGGKSPLTALETFGCGCAFLDPNEDGWLDILLVGEPECALFLNDGIDPQAGTPRFRDASAESGLAGLRGQWKGCAVGDFTGDGHMDLVLTGFRCIAALRGRGDGTFADVTAAFGLKESGWGSSAGLMDLDGDLDLDLVIGHYVRFGPDAPRYCFLGPGVKTGCPPRTYQPEFARLFRNDRERRFTDVSQQAGMRATHGKALVLAFTDLNSDGLQDFYIGNDGTPADMLQNQGGLHFKNVAVPLGLALGVYGQAQAAMGADWGDFDRDGRLDLVVTAFSDEPYSLYRCVGAYYDNVSTQVGIAEPTLEPLGFGAKFVDADNDGWLDLVFANGHVYDAVHKIHPGRTYLQPMQFLKNRQGRYTDVSRSCGADFVRPILGRGLATGDCDNDGQVEILVVDYEGAPVLLRNEAAPRGHWLALKLIARRKNVFAYGARVTVRAGKSSWVQELSPASSYLSSSSPTLHFGLGDHTAVEEIRVRWPRSKTGREETFRCEQVDRRLDLFEGRGEPRR